MIHFTTTELDALLRNGKSAARSSDHWPVAKLILPGTGCAWLISALHTEGGEAFGYGLADNGYAAPSLGPFSLRSLERLRDPWRLHRVQTDKTFKAAAPLSAYAYAACRQGAIVEDFHRAA